LAEKYQSIDQVLVQTGQSIEMEDSYVDSNHQQRWYRIVRLAVLNPSGEVVASQGMSWDVTATKEIEQSLKLAKEAAESAGLA
jgi:hypothetical protein